MGYVSSSIGNVSSASKSGMWWQDEELPQGENWLGKYKDGCSHYGGKSYVKVWYIGDKFDPDRTYTAEYCKKNNLGKYANSGASDKAAGGAAGGGKKLSFGRRIARLGGQFVLASVAEGLAKSSQSGGVGAGAKLGAKKPLPKPKPVRPKSMATPSASSTPLAPGAKRSLLPEKKGASIAKARPTAAASRGSVLKQVKSAPAGTKGGAVFGRGVKGPAAPKRGGLMGGAKAKPASKRSGGLLGGAKAKPAPKKSGGLLGGAKKSAAPKKSGGLLGGGAKKSGGMKLGLGKRRR